MALPPLMAIYDPKEAPSRIHLLRSARHLYLIAKQGRGNIKVR